MPDLFITKEGDLEPETKEEKAILASQKRGPHMLSSYCENPDRIKFVESEPDEQILLFLRKDLITNIPWILTSMLLLLIPIPLFSFIKTFSVDLSFMPAYSLFLLSVFYYLLVFAYAIVSYFTWFFNISMITQKRVIDIDFAGLVYKNVAATKIEFVEDVSYVQIGVLRNVFDYGDVLIQTAGAMDNFKLHAVPKPERVIQIVEELIGRENHE